MFNNVYIENFKKNFPIKPMNQKQNTIDNLNNNVNIILGIDFDNTIINYDKLIYSLALEKSFLPAETPKNKKAVRDTIRQLPDGDLKWQEIQAEAYGPSISKATLNPGVKKLLATCHQFHIPYYIISHKTKYSNLLNGGTNLQEAALHWMQQQHFFNDHKFRLSKKQIFFLSIVVLYF